MTLFLARCLKSIPCDLVDIVFQKGPHEPTKPSRQDYKPSHQYPTVGHFFLQLVDHASTNVVFMPSSEIYYVYINKDYSVNHVCHWMIFVDASVAKSGSGNEPYY